jgi:hypothetical protein
MKPRTEKDQTMNMNPALAADTIRKLGALSTGQLITVRDAAMAQKRQEPLTKFMAFQADRLAKARPDYASAVTETCWQDVLRHVALALNTAR